MTVLSALEIGSNYPKNTLIDVFQDKNNNLYGAILYMLKEEHIHKVMLNHNKGYFSSEQEAVESMELICKEAVDYIKEYKNDKSRV